MKSFSKTNFVKVLGATTLAALIATAGIFAFAPFRASAQSNSNSQNPSLNNNVNNSTSQSTEFTGLITPRSDDPVLFTTESGLEIKYGYSTADNVLQSANLLGFPYFNTTSGSSSYTWVIIGLSSSFLISETNSYIFGLWYQTETSNSINFQTNTEIDMNDAGNKILGESYFNGCVIDSEFTAPPSGFKVKANSEIPANCVLVLSNNVLGTGTYRSTNITSGTNPVYYYPNFNNSDIQIKMQDYYTNGSFGLSAIKNSIHLMSLVTARNYNTETTSAYIFPLATYSGATFYWNNYLSASQLNIGSDFWLRGDGYSNSLSDQSTSGKRYGSAGNFLSTGSVVQSVVRSSSGYRPAFVMNLV